MCKGTLVVSLRPGIIRESVVAVQKGFLEWFIEVFVGGGGTGRVCRRVWSRVIAET